MESWFTFLACALVVMLMVLLFVARAYHASLNAVCHDGNWSPVQDERDRRNE